MRAVMTITEQPGLRFPRLPERWIAAAWASLPGLADEIEGQIRDEVSAYREDPGGVVHANVRGAVEAALTAFVKGLTGQHSDDHLEVFRRLGRLEVAAGRSHDTLQLAYRVATVQVGGYLTVIAQQVGASSAQQAAVRHAAIEFLEHLASLSRAGYEQAELAGAAETAAVTRLLDLLVASSETTRSRIEDAAGQVRWTVPERVRAVEFVPAAAMRPEVLRRLHGKRPSAVAAGRLGERCLGFVDAELDLAFVDELLPIGARAVFGPPVQLLSAGDSSRLAARFSARLPRSAVGARVLRCDDQLLTLFGSDAADVMNVLAQTRLTPLMELGVVRRVKAARVLAAMLEYGGIPRGAAEFAGTSPSTLQYRRAMVEEMFGAALRERERRVELILVLRAVLPQWEAELAMHLRRTSARRTP